MLIIDIETTHRDDAADFIDPVEAPSNYGAEAASRYVLKAREKAIVKAACAPDLNRPVLVGLLYDTGKIYHIWFHSPEDEADDLADVWTDIVVAHGHDEALVTFGGLGMDWPTLARRSQILGVPIPDWFSLDKYRSPLAKGDLAHVLTFGGALGHHRSLRTYCRLFGIPCEPEPFTGADVPRLYAEGRYDEIAAKNAADLRLTAALAQRLGVVPAPVAQPQEAVR